MARFLCLVALLAISPKCCANVRTRILIFSNEIASAQTIELRVPSKGGVEEYFSFVKQWNVQNQLNVFVQASPTRAAICLLFRLSEQELTLVASPLQFFFLSTYKSTEYDEDKTRRRKEETIKTDETEAEIRCKER